MRRGCHISWSRAPAGHYCQSLLPVPSASRAPYDPNIDIVAAAIYAHGIPARQAPVFCLRKSPGGEMAAPYFESFERVWDGATPLA